MKNSTLDEKKIVGHMNCLSYIRVSFAEINFFCATANFLVFFCFPIVAHTIDEDGLTTKVIQKCAGHKCQPLFYN